MITLNIRARTAQHMRVNSTVAPRAIALTFPIAFTRRREASTRFSSYPAASRVSHLSHPMRPQAARRPISNDIRRA